MLYTIVYPLATFATSQSNPSYSPSPFVATADWTCHLRFFSCGIPRASHTSDGVKHPFMSWERNDEGWVVGASNRDEGSRIWT